VLGLKAVNCENGDTLAQEQVTATSKENVLDVLDLIGSYLYQVHLYHWLESYDYGRFLADNDL
jgi:hypothetical protein